MIRLLNKKIRPKGQSIVEYSLVVSAIVAALLAMSVYAKRGLQAAIKDGADRWGNQSVTEGDLPSGMTRGGIMDGRETAHNRLQHNGPGTTSYIDESTNSFGVIITNQTN